MNFRVLVACGAGLLVLAQSRASLAAGTFSVATYNLENYLDQPSGHRRPKSEAAKVKIRECIRALGADLLAVEEMGSSPLAGRIPGKGSSSMAEDFASAADSPNWTFKSTPNTNSRSSRRI